jgi:hypothetical protein
MKKENSMFENTLSSSIEFFVNEIDSKVEKFLKTMERTNAQQLGLDYRAGHNLFVGQECIGVRNNSADQRSLEYYGGFEYIDFEDRIYAGDYIFYLDSDDRVAKCIERFADKNA